MTAAIEQVRARLEILRAETSRKNAPSRRVCAANAAICLSNIDLIGTGSQVGDRTAADWIECAAYNCEAGAKYAWGFNRPANW